MTTDELVRWLESLDARTFEDFLNLLGYNLTVSARTAYTTDRETGNVHQLMGFNELQHQVYGRRMALRTGHEWTTNSFSQGLVEKATFYNVEGELGWAVDRAISVAQATKR